MANNIVYRSISVSGTNVSETNNHVIGRDGSRELANLFIDPEAFDFHLLDNTLTQDVIIRPRRDL